MRIVGSPFCTGSGAAGDPTDALLADQSHSIPDNLVALFGALRAWNCSADKRLLEAAARPERLRRTLPSPFLMQAPKAQTLTLLLHGRSRSDTPQTIDQSRSTIALTGH